MKKLIALLLAALMLFTLAACGDNAETAAPAESGSTASSASSAAMKLRSSSNAATTSVPAVSPSLSVN